MVEIIDPRNYSLTDDDILSFHRMISAPDQSERNYVEPLEESNEEVIKSSREQVLSQEKYHAFWAKTDGQIVGMAKIGQSEIPFKMHCAELAFGVSEKYQRQGIGYQLVCKAIDKAHAIGIKRLEAECFADNMQAIALLQKVGFKEEGIRIRAIQKRDILRDIRLFGLLL